MDTTLLLSKPYQHYPDPELADTREQTITSSTEIIFLHRPQMTSHISAPVSRYTLHSTEHTLVEISNKLI